MISSSTRLQCPQLQRSESFQPPLSVPTVSWWFLRLQPPPFANLEPEVETIEVAIPRSVGSVFRCLPFYFHLKRLNQLISAIWPSFACKTRHNSWGRLCWLVGSHLRYSTSTRNGLTRAGVSQHAFQWLTLGADHWRFKEVSYVPCPLLQTSWASDWGRCSVYSIHRFALKVDRFCHSKHVRQILSHSPKAVLYATLC